MRKVFLLFKATFVLLLSPVGISKGQRRRAVVKAKKMFVSANLF